MVLDLGHDIVKALYIFNKKNGRPFIRFVKNQQDFAVESFLVIGFLTAILKFSKEVGKTDLKIIDMEDLRFIFTEKDGIVFTAITATTINPIDLLFKLKTIESIFLNEFTPDELSNSRLELEYFNKFIPVVDEIIHGDVRYIEPEEKEEVREKLKKFLKTHEKLFGLALISFTGEFIIDEINDPDYLNAVKSLFNAVFGTRLTGITHFFVNFSFGGEYAIYIKRIEEETLIAVIGKSEQYLLGIADNITNLIDEIEKIISERSRLRT